MEYQKIANLIEDNTLNQPSKFRTRNWIEINDESRGAYNVHCQIKFKTTMLKSSLCDCSDAYILVKGTISINNTAAQGAAANNTNKKVIFKNCAPFTNCISEINNINSQIKFKTAMLKSSLCDYSDAYILVKGTISINNTAAAGAAANNTNKKVIFRNCAPFNNCISKINNTQIDNAKDIDIVMPMYNLIEYSDNYAKTTGSLWQYCKDIPARNANDDIVIFAENNTTNSFKFKAKITGQTEDDGTRC